MLSVEPHGVNLRFARPPQERVSGSGILSIMAPCAHFLRLYAIRLKPQEKKSSCGCFEWFIRISFWTALLAYGIVGVLILFSLFTSFKKGTTLLSSEGVHAFLAYEAATLLMAGVLSRRRRRHLNEYVVRLEKCTRSKDLPVWRCYTFLLYALLIFLFIHSACLAFTTSMLQYKIVAPESKVIPLPTDNNTSSSAGGNDQGPSRKGTAGGGDLLGNSDVVYPGGRLGGGFVDPMGDDGSVGGGLQFDIDNGRSAPKRRLTLKTFGTVGYNNEDMDQQMEHGGGGLHQPVGGNADGRMSTENAEADYDELSGRRRRRKRGATLLHPDHVGDVAPLAGVVEMTVIAERIEEKELEQNDFQLNLGLENVSDTTAGGRPSGNRPNVVSVAHGGRLSRVRRGLLDTAIDDSIDNNGINFIELFKPFLPIINGIRYLLIKNIIYLSATLASCFCFVIRRRLVQINQQLAYKVKQAELSTELLADIRLAYSQCISLLRDVERNFSFFCFLWNWLVFLETLYIGRMLYEVNMSSLYELPTSAVTLWMAFHNTVLALDLVLVVVFQSILTEAATSARLQALQTVDLVTIGTASIPPNRIEAHQQAELLVSIATIQNPGLTAWDIASHSRSLGYSVLSIAYIVLFTYIQFLHDGRWRSVFGTVLQRQEPTPATADSMDDLNARGGLGLDVDGQVQLPSF